MDILSKNDRKIRMRSIRSKNTMPELVIRRLLFKNKIRYRLNNKRLPGRPDISIKKYKLIVDIRGCFWHRHQNCPKTQSPITNKKFWEKKFNNNINRDKMNEKKLKDIGYKVFIIWECEILKNKILNHKVQEIIRYIQSEKSKSFN